MLNSNLKDFQDHSLLKINLKTFQVIHDYEPQISISQSPWAQFFQDNELRKVIMQDIKRTYPGELMFEQIEIRDIMLNILFIYAREQPEIDYKQVFRSSI